MQRAHIVLPASAQARTSAGVCSASHSSALLPARGPWHVRSAEHLPWADASQYTLHERPVQFALWTYGEYWPGDATTHARQPPTCKNLDDNARRCCDTSTANALIHQRRHSNDFGVLR